MNLFYQDYFNSFYMPQNPFQYGTSGIDENIMPFTRNTTNLVDTERENRKFTDSLRASENLFLNILSKTDFEDGITNEAIEYIKNKLDENSYATALWLCELYSKYPIDNNNIEASPFVRYGIMRIIAYINNKDCFNFIKGALILMVETSLASDISYIQEAALMVIESWRDFELLPLLEENKISDLYLKNYCNALKMELKNEKESFLQKKEVA